MNSSHTRFERLFEEHYRDVLAYALRRTDGHTAQEIVSETFLVAWLRLDEVPDHARPWLFVVARNHLLNHHRGARRRRLAEEELLALAQATSVAGHSDQVVDQIVLLCAVDTLSDADRELLMLLAWEGLTTTDVATVLGCSRTAARVRIHRARSRLVAAFDAAGEQRTAPLPLTLDPEETR